tara:strand:- start:913 stop:1530 length:618 start_codon:yes stop_codon:yes gene_type:complete
MEKEILSKSEKILHAIYELEKKRKKGEKISKEMMVVKAWKMFPSEFSMQGYPQYPNADISKYVTKLFKENLSKGGFFDYKITEKGVKYIEKLIATKEKKNKTTTALIETPRYLKSEISRIVNSKVFKYFVNGEKDFLENDLFEFLGTSARSFKDSNKSSFLARYNLITQEVIPLCRTNSSKDEDSKKIVDLWNILSNKFGDILKK